MFLCKSHGLVFTLLLMFPCIIITVIVSFIARRMTSIKIVKKPLWTKWSRQWWLFIVIKLGTNRRCLKIRIFVFIIIWVIHLRSIFLIILLEILCSLWVCRSFNWICILFCKRICGSWIIVILFWKMIVLIHLVL